MRAQTFDWLVRVYDKKERVIGHWTIKDRTEHEAEEEAVADLKEFPNYDDWTMTKLP